MSVVASDVKIWARFQESVVPCDPAVDETRDLIFMDIHGDWASVRCDAVERVTKAIAEAYQRGYEDRRNEETEA
jgi:hypothetical protein